MKNPQDSFNDILARKIKWLEIILFYSANGFVYMYLLFKYEGIINIESLSSTLATLVTMFIFGAIFGIILNFTLGFFIKLTGKLFGGINNLKSIYKVLAWAHFPSTIYAYLIIVNILLAKIISQNNNTLIILIGSFIIIIFSIIQLMLAVWEIFLIYKGLQMAQKLNVSKTILNYISSAILFGMIYHIFISPFI